MATNSGVIGGLPLSLQNVGLPQSFRRYRHKRIVQRAADLLH